MKILYGVQGTGNGHVSRSTRIIDRLQQCGASVDVLFSGCETDKIYEKEIIRTAGFYKGFTFCINAGAINVAATIRQLSPLKFVSDVRSLDLKGVDLIITDFEPVTALAARIHGIPSIGIGHQYAFSYDIPVAAHSFWPLLLTRNFAPAGTAIGMHWHHFNQPILPPVIPEKVKASDMCDPSLIVVYLPFEHKKHIAGLLKPFSDYRFTVYAGGTGEKAVQEGNIAWHPFSKTTFYRDLARCSGVICNAGFELPSEALFLGQKVLVKPLKGQFEQASNGLAMDRLQLGSVMERLEKKAVARWLDKPDAKRLNFPEVADLIAQWVMNGDWKQIAPLVSKAWQ